jgi:ribosomal protein L24E
VSDRCSWCGREVEEGDGFRAYEPAGSRRAVFCRLEHLVPWAIRGASWEPGPLVDDRELRTCSWCGDELHEAHVLMVRSRGEHRVPDGFCSVAHLLEWAKAGGRYR